MMKKNQLDGLLQLSMVGELFVVNITRVVPAEGEN